MISLRSSVVLTWLVLMVVSSPLIFAQDRSQARSMVISRNGIVASEHPLASQAGVRILEAGGHAVDAAVAVNAAMGVVSPMMCGIGGDLFAIVYDAKTGKLHGLNASGWSGAAMNLDFIKAQGFTNMPVEGIHSVTVPGAVDGWHQLLSRFGRLPLSKAIQPAIQLAEQGFPVSELVAQYWVDAEKLLRKDENATTVYLPFNRPPRVGQIFRNPDLAWSYKQLAEHGRKAFYDGVITERILNYSKRKNGTLTREDFKEYAAEWVIPISTTYRGWTVYEIPPNGQGIAALAMLNIMEKFPLAEYGHNSTEALHVMIEAKKLAYADMIQNVADQKFATTPVAQLLSKDYAQIRAAMIDPAKAFDSANLKDRTGTDTTYISVVDREGNMVSLIQSVYYAFGSGVVPTGVGFVLQNRGGGFSLDPNHPNVVAGRKRPLHTIIPGFMAKGTLQIAFGIMGGWNQAQAHAQFVSNVADHKMNIQAALEAARFTKLTFNGMDVAMEGRIPESVRTNLFTKGHQIEVLGDFSSKVGGGQAVMRDLEQRVNFGASDPRKDGAAIPELIPE